MNRTVETMIYSIREMRPRLDSRAREIEAARRVPGDILDELQRLGVFRMNAPRSHGGLELPLRESCEVVTELAKIDGVRVLERGRQQCAIVTMDVPGRDAE